MRKLAADYPVALVNSVNPERLQGQKTASFEVVDALGDAPDVHCLPVGNAGNIAAYWLGYQEYLADGKATRRRGCWASRRRARRRSCAASPVLEPVTVATAIRIGNPASWHLAEEARARVWRPDRMRSPTTQILAAYRLLAQREGVFGEPASAAGVAGLLQASEAGQVAPRLGRWCARSPGTA